MVLDQVGVAGPDDAALAAERVVVVGLAGRGKDDGSDGFAGGVPGFIAAGGLLLQRHGRPGGQRGVVFLVQSGQDGHAVGFAAGRAVARAAGAAAVELGLDGGALQPQAGRAAEDDGDDGRAVRFARPGHSEERAAEKFHLTTPF